MTKTMRFLMLGAVAALSVGTYTPGSAATIGLTAASSFGPGASTYDLSQLGGDGTVLLGSQPITGTHNGSLAISSSAGTFNRVDEGGSWFSNFAIGTPLVSTNPGALSDLGFTFANPVKAFGLQIAAATYGQFTATETVFNSAGKVLGSFNETGDSELLGDNSAIFIGLSSNTTDIARALLTITSGVSGGTNDFAVGNVVSSVPLPAGLPLFASAITGLVALRRRKKISA